MLPTHTAFAAGYSFAIYDTLFVQLWHATATLEGVRQMKRLISEAPKFDAMLVIVDDFTAMPSDGVREEIVRISRALGSVFSIVIYDGTGFKAAALRALITGILAVAGKRSMMGVFTSLAEAHEWAVRQGRRLPDIRALEAMVAELRERPKVRVA